MANMTREDQIRGTVTLEDYWRQRLGSRWGRFGVASQALERESPGQSVVRLIYRSRA